MDLPIDEQRSYLKGLIGRGYKIESPEVLESLVQFCANAAFDSSAQACDLYTFEIVDECMAEKCRVAILAEKEAFHFTFDQDSAAQIRRETSIDVGQPGQFKPVTSASEVLKITNWAMSRALQRAQDSCTPFITGEGDDMAAQCQKHINALGKSRYLSRALTL